FGGHRRASPQHCARSQCQANSAVHRERSSGDHGRPPNRTYKAIVISTLRDEAWGRYEPVIHTPVMQAVSFVTRRIQGSALRIPMKPQACCALPYTLYTHKYNAEQCASEPIARS